MKIISVVGARPNFIKLAPFCDAVKRYNENNNNGVQHIIIHTGQHYDANMSDDFFTILGIDNPSYNLGVSASSHAEQVGSTMIKLESIFISEKPDWVVVYGDVNATMSAAITAKKLWIKVAHVEAGLRSYDMKMPEEINRIVTDRLSDLLFTTDYIADEILWSEGVDEKTVFRVGNIMIDSLEKHQPNAEKLNINDIVKSLLINKKQPFKNIQIKNFALVTLHRPSNVDDFNTLNGLVSFFINKVLVDMPIVWPIHPRTKNKLIEFGLFDKLSQNENCLLLCPADYHQMIKLTMSAKMVFTDSGGLQEESTVLGTPCLTLRWNTERPMTLTENGGASIIVGNDICKITEGYTKIMNGFIKPHKPDLWDGKTANRILEILLNNN